VVGVTTEAVAMPETRPVEIDTHDGTVPGLELVSERRIDGPENGPSQPRTVVCTPPDREDIRIALVDVAQERVAGIDGAEADAIADTLGPTVAEVFDGE
jgi:hypothetical protein